MLENTLNRDWSWECSGEGWAEEKLSSWGWYNIFNYVILRAPHLLWVGREKPKERVLIWVLQLNVICCYIHLGNDDCGVILILYAQLFQQRYQYLALLRPRCIWKRRFLLSSSCPGLWKLMPHSTTVFFLPCIYSATHTLFHSCHIIYLSIWSLLSKSE